MGVATRKPFRVDVESFPEARDVRKRWKTAGLPVDSLELRRVRREDGARERPGTMEFLATPLTDGNRPLGPAARAHGYIRDGEAFLGVSLPLVVAGPLVAVHVQAEDGRTATVALPVMVENSGTPGAFYTGTIYVGAWDK